MAISQERETQREKNDLAKVEGISELVQARQALRGRPDEYLHDSLSECIHDLWAWARFHESPLDNDKWQYSEEKDKPNKKHDLLKPLSEFTTKELDQERQYDTGDVDGWLKAIEEHLHSCTEQSQEESEEEAMVTHAQKRAKMSDVSQDPLSSAKQLFTGRALTQALALAENDQVIRAAAEKIPPNWQKTNWQKNKEASPTKRSETPFDELGEAEKETLLNAQLDFQAVILIMSRKDCI